MAQLISDLWSAFFDNSRSIIFEVIQNSNYLLRGILYNFQIPISPLLLCLLHYSCSFASLILDILSVNLQFMSEGINFVLFCFNCEPAAWTSDCFFPFPFLRIEFQIILPDSFVKCLDFIQGNLFLKPSKLKSFRIGTLFEKSRRIGVIQSESEDQVEANMEGGYQS